MAQNTRNYSGGVGFTGLLTLIFITLKLTHVIDWGWFYVLLPAIVSISIGVMILVAVSIYLAIGWYINRP